MEKKNSISIYLSYFVVLLSLLLLVSGNNSSLDYNLNEYVSGDDSITLIEADNISNPIEADNISNPIEQNKVEIDLNNPLLINESDINTFTADYISEKEIPVIEDFDEITVIEDFDEITVIEDFDEITVINIDLIEIPNVSVFDKRANFEFYINISNISELNCDFLINGSNSFSYNETFSSQIIEIDFILNNSNYSWNLYCYDAFNLSVNTSKNGFFNLFYDYSPIIGIWTSKNNTLEGEKVDVYINITLLEGKIALVTMDYGDGTLPLSVSYINSNVYYNWFGHVFEDEGNYTLDLKVYSIDGSIYNKKLNVSVIRNTSVQITNKTIVTDAEKPIISLVEPENEVTLSNYSISFKYRASDNVKISNCTFNLYYYNNSGNIGSLVYQEVKNNPANDELIGTSLTDFDNGDYSWDIECYDNSTNYKVISRDFNYFSENESIISFSSETSSYSNEIMEVDDLISKINEFLVNEEKYDKESKEIVEKMDILESARYYKKRLLQIRNDLEDDLGYNKDIETKNSRLNEIKDELEKIRKNGVYSVSVSKSESFSKSSISSDLSEVVSDYLESEKIFMKESEKKKLIDNIEDIQKDVNIEISLAWIEFERLDGEKEKFSLVYKKVDFEEYFEGIIEVIPKSVSENYKYINFSLDFDVIKEDPIVYIDSEYINSSFYYMIKGYIDFEDLKEIDSVGFVLSGNGGGNSITGYSIFFLPSDKGFWFYFSWILVIFFIVMILYNSFRLGRIRRLKEDLNYQRLKSLLKEGNNSMDDKNIGKAKEIYSKIKNIYSESNSNIKDYFYKDLIRLQLSIDRKEISDLIRECVDAINDKRAKDASILYSKIKPIYKRLPKDLRSKVYSKIIPFIN